MKTIDALIYKYGVLSDKMVLTFNTEEEVSSFISNSEEFSNECREEENQYGENLYKYKQVLEYKGIRYVFYLDL